MGVPDSIEQFLAGLYSHSLSRRQLEKLYQKIPAERRAAALLGVFADTSRPDDAFRDQTIAGQLLVEGMPGYPPPLRDVLKDIAHAWNASVEELPHYLARVFGRAEVVEAATALAREFGEGTDEAARMNTVLYWLTGETPGRAPLPDQ